MFDPGESFTASYPALPESIPSARAALAEFASAAGAGEDQLHAIRLAASEAITNAVRHAYLDNEPTGQVQVSASYLEGELWLLIADSGTGLRASSHAPGLGLGLALIAQLADDFQIHSRGSGGTELQLRFRLPTRESRSATPTGQLRGSVSRAVSPA